MIIKRTQFDRRRPTAAGFTLIEATISVVIVGVILVASLNVLGTTARMRQVRAAQDKGTTLAQDLMTEILAARFKEPDDAPVFGPEAPETASDRAGWDDIDDYHGWSASPPEDRNGVPIAKTTGWTRWVTVGNVVPETMGGQGLNEPNPSLRVIRVKVTAPDGTLTALDALRSAYGAHEQAPPVDTTYVTQIDIDLVVGADASGAAGAVNLVNHVIGGP